MTERILGPEGSKRRKRFWLAPLLVAMLATAFYVAGAQAVHDTSTFELEGDAIDSPAGGADDWNNVYALVNANADSKCTELGAIECAFVTDPRAPRSSRRVARRTTSTFRAGGTRAEVCRRRTRS